MPDSSTSGNKIVNNPKCQSEGNVSENDVKIKTKNTEEGSHLMNTEQTNDEMKADDTCNYEEKTENINSLLGTLARERQARAQAQPQIAPKKVTKKKKSKGGKSVGSSKKKVGKAQRESDDKGLDDLDDMAFLDAPIEKVQTSHGRKIEGSGKNYKTIVNGVLIAKPKLQEKKKIHESRVL